MKRQKVCAGLAQHPTSSKGAQRSLTFPTALSNTCYASVQVWRQWDAVAIVLIASLCNQSQSVNVPGGGQCLFTSSAQGWQFPSGTEQEWWELGPAWQTQQVETQAVLPYGWGRDTENVKPAPTTFLFICPSRCPALRQHLQLCPHQEGQLHSGGTAPRRGHAEIRQGAHTCLGNFSETPDPLLSLYISYPAGPSP